MFDIETFGNEDPTMFSVVDVHACLLATVMTLGAVNLKQTRGT